MEHVWGDIMMGRSLFAAAGFFVIGTMSAAQNVRITEAISEARFAIAGQNYSLSRIQDPNNAISGEFARTSRDCPPFCIQPFSAGDGVETVGELEVIEFLQNSVSQGRGLLVDPRRG